jgi:hypothetical protein
MQNYGQSWEALVGFLRLTAGYGIFTTYYVALPILSNFLIALCLFLFLHFNGHRFALLITLAVLLLMFEWGESGNLHGHYYATRIYQGKSVFIMLLVPLIFLHTQVLAQTDNWLNRVQLALLLIVSGGLSSTGLYLSVIAAGAAFLVYSELSLPYWIKGLRTLVIAALPNIVMLLMAKAQMVGIALGEYTWDRKIPEYFGNGYLYVSLLCLMFWAIAALKVPPASMLRRISAVSLLLLMNPVIAEFLRTLSGISNLYWRYYWMVPISVIISLAVSQLISSAGVLLRPFKNPVSSTFNLQGVGVLLLLTMWMIYSPTAFRSRFVVPFTDSALRLNNIGRIPQHIKTAARRLNDNLSERDIVLAPSWISMNLAKLEYRLKFTLIRPYYNKRLLRVGFISQSDYSLLSSATDKLNRKYDPGTQNLDQSDLEVLYSMLERGLATVLLLPTHMASFSDMEVFNQEKIQAQKPRFDCENLDRLHVVCRFTN